MRDADVRIDIPDDDAEPVQPSADGPGEGLPLWRKLLVVALVGLLVGGAYLVLRDNKSDSPAPAGTRQPDGAGGAVEPASQPAATAEPSISASPEPAGSTLENDEPAVRLAVAAIEAWSRFNATADPAVLEGHYDPQGPQYRLLVDGGPTGGDLDVTTVELAEPVEPGVDVVAIEVSFSTGEPRNQALDVIVVDDQVWTIVDSDSTQPPVLPPDAAAVGDAAGSWGRFASAMSAGDADAAVAELGGATATWLDELTAAASGGPATATDPVLVDLVRRAGTEVGRGGALVAILSDAQLDAIIAGELTEFGRLADHQMIATLAVDGAPTAVVFFVLEDRWRVDLQRGYSEASSGTVTE